jgi:hypothetical protein
VRTADGRRFRVEPADRAPGVEMPDEFEPRKLAKRTLQIVAVLAVVGSCGCSPPAGRGPRPVERGAAEWVALAVAFEAMSCVSYVRRW